MAPTPDGTIFSLNRIDVACEGLPTFYPNCRKPKFDKLKAEGLSMAVGIQEMHGVKENMLNVYIDRLPKMSVKGMVCLATVKLT
ncbi:hypothetical protein PGT21_008148 [Puccinia graminis f. sp. tritici]|uniref:Uncharacterized protein n=1 Tax=Puccinia graminis f. sp. tritici TaxID=56615 RepID=A0A5B0NQ95_PUCGR|nr:hypothetical protein PGT21_008148 [Puccinia graminis f. sp. tritici]KAA1090088.1 hypothetical protein PGTUg99_035368 [Puccinia graminis f. sp. tritici]